MTTLLVLYPTPADAATFDRRYRDEHAPMVGEHLSAAKFRALTVVGSPAGAPPFHRIAELKFESAEAMQQALGTAGGKATAAHAMEISTGGAPIFLVCEEDAS
jgi:uncharacterized protein (TIGR02118 family)